MQRSSRSSKTIRLSKMIQDVSQRSPAVVAQTQDAHHVRWGPRSKLQLLQHQGQAPQRFQVAHRCRGNLCQFHKMLVKHVGWMNPAQEMSQNAAIESIDSCEMMLLFIPRCGANASMRQYVCWVWHSMAQQWPEKCWIWASYKGHGWAGWWHSIAVVCLSKIWYWIHSSDNSVYSFEDAKFHDVSLFMMIMKQLYFMMRSFMGLPKNTIVYHDWSPTTILGTIAGQTHVAGDRFWALCRASGRTQVLLPWKSTLPHWLSETTKEVVSNLGTKKTSQMTQMQSLSTLFHGSSAHPHGCRCFLHYLKNDRWLEWLEYDHPTIIRDSLWWYTTPYVMVPFRALSIGI